MRITFAPAKHAWTLKERGLDFSDAAEFFAGPYTSLLDDRFDYGEAQYISAGYLRGADGRDRMDLPAMMRGT